MARKKRLTLLVFGLALALFSIIALAYATWPLEVNQAASTLPAFFFSPP
jgi:hypothetical protein